MLHQSVKQQSMWSTTDETYRITLVIPYHVVIENTPSLLPALGEHRWAAVSPATQHTSSSGMHTQTHCGLTRSAFLGLLLLWIFTFWRKRLKYHSRQLVWILYDWVLRGVSLNYIISRWYNMSFRLARGWPEVDREADQWPYDCTRLVENWTLNCRYMSTLSHAGLFMQS